MSAPRKYDDTYTMLITAGLSHDEAQQIARDVTAMSAWDAAVKDFWPQMNYSLPAAWRSALYLQKMGRFQRSAQAGVAILVQDFHE